MDARAHERGREVRARLLAGLAATAAALAAPAAAHAGDTTGRLLVTLTPSAKAHAAATAIAARAGARPVTGRSVPQLRLMTVKPHTGTKLHALATKLRAEPGVAQVEVERRAHIRATPNDPALTQQEPTAGTPAGVPLEWWAVRENFPAAWDVSRGSGAKVAIIDTGADGSHPDLQGRIATAIDLDDLTSTAATYDESGHGTFDASIACGTANNAIGIAGAGYGCSLIVIKSDFSDSSVAKAIVAAADQGAEAINMSFGTDGSRPAAQPIVDAIDYAVRKGAVPVAAAADDPITEQGDPSNVIQPTGTGPDITKGTGLSVTAANVNDQRASFAGLGTQISLAAYGAWQYPAGGPRGLFGAFPANQTQLEASALVGGSACNCRTSLAGDTRYAYLQGTSMAAPQVAAAAALVRHLNPDLTTQQTVRLLKATARRPSGGFTNDLGWGILDAGAALNAAKRTDARAPTTTLKASKPSRTRVVTLTLKGADAGPPGVAVSGLAKFRVYRKRGDGSYAKIAATTKTKLKVKVQRGATYSFYALGVDKAGNVGPTPVRPQARVRVARR